MSISFVTEFVFGQIVVVDDDPEIKGKVIAFLVEEGSYDVKLAWFHNGSLNEEWFRSNRVKPA